MRAVRRHEDPRRQGEEEAKLTPQRHQQEGDDDEQYRDRGHGEGPDQDHPMLAGGEEHPLIRQQVASPHGRWTSRVRTVPATRKGA